MSETILILAPKGRDARVIEQVLQRYGVSVLVCTEIAALHERLDQDSGGILVTEEALAGPDLEALLLRIETQPPWSDIPVIVLASKQAGKRSAIAASMLERLGNVVILERPINAETLLSSAKSALRGRRRQYQARAHLEERRQNENLLQSLNETLEKRVHERARELARARDNLDFALDSAGMGSWELDLNTRIVRRTPGHDRIFGYADPLPHWDLPLFLGHVIEDDRPAAESAFHKAVTTGAFDLECKIRRADGELRWIAAKGKIGHAETGAPVCMAGVVMDTTERRFAEEALRHSQKMQAIGQLTGGLAHDFNNLLTGITGSLDLLQTRAAQGRISEFGRYIDAAQGAARRAAALTHRLLAFSRQQTLVAKPTDINKLVAGIEELLRRTMGPSITVAVAASDDLWTTCIDAGQLENALLNLCINARDAMPDGGRLTIETTNLWMDARAARDRDMKPGQYATLSVSDTGMGMEPEVIRRAFDPFFTTKPIGMGTGLGLSMIYGFVRQSGGQARIYSELGQGTMVSLYLPRHLGPAEVHGEPVAIPQAPRAEQGEAVLVVDDEPTVRMLVTEVLNDLGYAAIEAADGRSGIDILRSDRRIDLLITDVGLPAGMNGRQVADAGRNLRPELKVLFITGFAENAVFGNGQLDPGIHILTKPFALDVLATRIREVIAGK
jgi:C4-dicarboxylate-specific signal transduction histidine kinase